MPQLRCLLDESSPRAHSVLENRLHALLRRYFSGWEANVPFDDELGLIGIVDVLFVAARLVIEVDGRAYHADNRFQSYWTRKYPLIRAGYTALRLTYDDDNTSATAGHRAHLRNSRRPAQCIEITNSREDRTDLDFQRADRDQPGGHPIARPPITWTWTWKTDFPPDGPVFVTSRKPAAIPSWSATAAAAANNADVSAGSCREIAVMSWWWARGITRTCVGACGLMSRNATVRSSARTTSAGISPAMIGRTDRSGRMPCRAG